MVKKKSNKKKGLLRLGTRGSLLALHQTHLVKSALEQKYVEEKLTCQPVIIKTKGDLAPLAKPNRDEALGLFTKELEEALIRNEIDIAVHSLKDLPTELASGLIVGAVLPREDSRDVLISRYGLTIQELADRKIDNLNNFNCLATSCLRRKAQLLYFCNKFQIKEIRGNIDTRLRKMESGYCDAIIVAGAGIKRIGMEHLITEYLDPEICMPAASQGIIGLEIREDDCELQELLKGINHPETSLCARIERNFLKAMQGGCELPLGCYSLLKNQQIRLTGILAHPEGKYVIKKVVACNIASGEELAQHLAEQLMQAGGKLLLKEIRDGI